MSKKLKILYADDDVDKLRAIDRCISAFLSIDDEVLVEAKSTDKLIGEGHFYDLLAKEDFDVIFADYYFNHTDSDIRLGSIYTFIFLAEKGRLDSSEVFIYSQWTQDLASGSSDVWKREGPLIAKLISYFTGKRLQDIFLPKSVEGKEIQEHLYRALSNWQEKNLEGFKVYEIFKQFEKMLSCTFKEEWEQVDKAGIDLLQLKVKDDRLFKYAFPQYAHQIHQAIRNKAKDTISIHSTTGERLLIKGIFEIWGEFSLLGSRVSEIYILYRLFRPDENFKAPRESSLHLITHSEIKNHDRRKARNLFNKALDAFNEVKNALHPNTRDLIANYLEMMKSTGFSTVELDSMLQEWERSYKPKLRIASSELVGLVDEFCKRNDIALSSSDESFSMYANREILDRAVVKILENIKQNYDQREDQERKLHVAAKRLSDGTCKISIRDYGTGIANLGSVFSGGRPGSGLRQMCADLKFYCDIKIETVVEGKFYSCVPCGDRVFGTSTEVSPDSAFASHAQDGQRGTMFTLTFKIPSVVMSKGGHVRTY